MSMLLGNAMNSNPMAQRLLAQSGNAAYAGRGIYRVSQTDPERKGDYWFRDFGMVMACTYMTELAFRATERYYTMPLLTNALGLHAMCSDNGNGQKRSIPEYQALPKATANAGANTAKTVTDKAQSERWLQKLYATHVYPQAMNYSEMPDALRKRMMGTLVRNSSDVVGQVLQKDALEKIEALRTTNNSEAANRSFKPESGFYEDLRSFIKQPLNPANEARFNEYLQPKKSGLNQQQLDELRQIVKADNEFAQQGKLDKFLVKHKITDPGAREKVQDTLQVLQNRQMGYLVNHLDRTLNFQHYVESNYLHPRVTPKEVPAFELPASLRRKSQYSQVSELGEVVSSKLSEYSQTLHSLQNSAKGDLRKVAFAVRKKPLEKRDEAFKELIVKVDNQLLLNKKESLLDFNTTVDKEDGKLWQDTYKQLWEYSNNLKREVDGVSNDHKFKDGINWQNDYYKKRADLRKYLLASDDISKKALEKELEHFSGFFEQMKTKLEIRNYQLEKIWHQLGTDLLVNVKKKIKDAALELNKIPDEHLPELKTSIAARAKARANNQEMPAKVLASRVDVMEARLRDIGLGQWNVLTTDRRSNEKGADFIRQLAERIVKPLESNKLERYANEGVMDLVKKEIFGQLTAYNKLDKQPESKTGYLFRLLCGEDLTVDGVKTTKNAKGLEELLKPLLNLENLHKAPKAPGELAHPEKWLPSTEWTVKSLILDGVQSKQVKGLVDKIQSNGTWPKMALTVGLNFIFYGWLASRFDNKVLQPYEEKLVARKGTSQDIVTAGYLGVIPAVGVLSQLFDKVTLEPLKKMNHFARFSSVGALALGTFAASSYGALKLLDKNPSDNAPQPASGLDRLQPQQSADGDAFKTGATVTPTPTFGNPAFSQRLPLSQPFPPVSPLKPAQPFNTVGFQTQHPPQWPAFQPYKQP